MSMHHSSFDLPAAKRQKTSASPQPHAGSSTAAYPEQSQSFKPLTPPPAMTATQVKPIRGRKRFVADLKEAGAVCEEGLEVQGLRVKYVRSGEDEGSLLCSIAEANNNKHVVTLNLTVSDTSDYPENHNFICFAMDEDVSHRILEVVETVPEEGSRAIADILRKLLSLLANRLASAHNEIEGIESDEGEDEDDEQMYDEHYDDEDDIDIATISMDSGVETTVLLRHFNETVAAGFRPGITRFGIDEVVLSASLPSFTLAESISPRALMAWDSRLLSSTHYFTLLITGIRGIYPVLRDDGRVVPGVAARGAKLQFRVGLSKQYKPNKEQVVELVRNFGLKEAQPVEAKPEPMLPIDIDDDTDYDSFDFHAAYRSVAEAKDTDEVDEEDPSFMSLSLSSSLESLLNDRFLDILHYRVKYGLGWAGAETLVGEIHRTQRDADSILQDHITRIQNADTEEEELSATYNLPEDPLNVPEETGHLNLPLLAFSYLLRRLTLCSRYCLVCYEKLHTDFVALKPYVCDDKLCTYQYYNLNRGPSLEYEICARPQTVDLLVSLTYVAAIEGGLADFPAGMNMSVSLPWNPNGGLVDFDTLQENEKQRVIADLLASLPPVADMKRHLEKKRRGGSKPKLRDIDHNILPAAWSVLRWCIASCTAHVEELTAPEDRIGNVGSEWRQFRFTVGAPDAEAKFYAEQAVARKEDDNARNYPSLYAFHGSPMKNWHSIIRHGLWYKTIANGRAYGNGVYFAKDGNISMASYASGASVYWPHTELYASSCVALAEIINRPTEFTSTNPYFVVQHTNWIVCRYLLIKTVPKEEELRLGTQPVHNIPTVKLDPKHPLTVGSRPISIPEPTYKLQNLLEQRREELCEEGYDDEDLAIFSADKVPPSDRQAPQLVEDDWVHDAEWVQACVEHMLPAPVDASPMATMALQKDLTAMLREQGQAKNLKELGWYMPQDFMSDNLFQWVVELHSFEPSLPIAKDFAARKVNSIVFEIRFPPDFPHSPPFFRILKPRFLPFIQGGGGHVTGGGSICMDLLTADGWLPSYSISAVLLQIRLAISNLEPRPARLALNWDYPYTMHEALEGYKRAANAHGWRIPATLDRLTT